MSKQPFILNGRQVLCLNCTHNTSYQVVFDELHKRDIFWAECEKYGQVGLPLDNCDDFDEEIIGQLPIPDTAAFLETRTRNALHKVLSAVLQHCRECSQEGNHSKCASCALLGIFNPDRESREEK